MNTITMPDPAEVQALTTLEDAVALLRRCTDQTVTVDESLWSDSGDERRRRYTASIFVAGGECVGSYDCKTIPEAVAEALKKAERYDPLADAKRKLQAAGYSVSAPA